MFSRTAPNQGAIPFPPCIDFSFSEPDNVGRGATGGIYLKRLSDETHAAGSVARSFRRDAALRRAANLDRPVRPRQGQTVETLPGQGGATCPECNSTGGTHLHGASRRQDAVVEDAAARSPEHDNSYDFANYRFADFTITRSYSYRR